MKLDKTDLKLLHELERDGRQTLSQIAKRLKTSQQVISYRLQQLEKKEVITEYYTIIELGKLGYSSYRTMLKLGNITDKAHKELIDYFMKHPNVLWLVECGGRWDIIVNLLAKNPIQYNHFLSEIKNKFKNILLDYDLVLTVEGTYAGKDYLVGENRELKKRPYFGKEIIYDKTDKLDLDILNLISENARMNSVEMAAKLKVSSNTVISRLKDMRKRGVIQGYKALIHLDKIGYHGYKALIKMNPVAEEKEKFFLNTLYLNNNITGVLKMIGQWDLEIEFEVKNRQEMLKLTRNIRTRFKDLIKEFEVIPLFHEYKYDFFPGDLLKTGGR